VKCSKCIPAVADTTFVAHGEGFNTSAVWSSGVGEGDADFAEKEKQRELHGDECRKREELARLHGCGSI